jgi:hypothetical protein
MKRPQRRRAYTINVSSFFCCLEGGGLGTDAMVELGVSAILGANDRGHGRSGEDDSK